MPGVAVADSTNAESGSFNDAVSFDCFPSVLGAGWIESALLSDQHAQGELIKRDEFDEDRFEHG